METPENTNSISVVIPVYNSEQSLPGLIDRLIPVLHGMTDRFEVILVNDGSRDGSWDSILALAGLHEGLSGIDLRRNYGQHNALLCGLRAAKHDVIITMDDDLQNPPEEIPRLLEVLEKGFDVVYGYPEKERHGLWRDLASKATKLALQGTMGVETASRVSAFRALRREVLEASSRYRSPFVSIDVLLTWGSARFGAVSVKHDARGVGASNYTFRKLLSHALTMMTGFSTLPLRLASVLGFALTIFGIGVLGYVVGRYLLQGSSVPGFPFLASIVAIFSGAQLLTLGIIGEYLARMHFRMMEQPPYSVRTASGGK